MDEEVTAINTRPAPRGAQTVLRAVALLEGLSSSRSFLTATQLARSTGLSTPTTHRILRTLESQSYVERDPRRGYRLGTALLRLAAAAAVRYDEIALLAETMAQIREFTGETVSLHRRVGDRRVCVAEDVSPQPVKVSSIVGRSYPLSAGAASKAIMSLLPDAEVERILDVPDDGSGRRPARAAFWRAVRDVRARGYATSVNETYPGATGLAVPFRRSDALAPGAIDLAGPTDRMTAKLLDQALPHLTAAAERVTQANAPVADP